MFNLGLSDNELEERVTGLGADCPFLRAQPSGICHGHRQYLHSYRPFTLRLASRFSEARHLRVHERSLRPNHPPKTRNAYHRHHPPPRRGMERPPDERFRRRSLCPPSRNRRHQGTAVRPGSGIRIHERFGFERFRPFPDGTGRNGYAQAFPWEAFISRPCFR